MVDLLLLVVPDHNEDLTPQRQQRTNTSQQTLDEDAKMLAEKLDRISKSLTRCGTFSPNVSTWRRSFAPWKLGVVLIYPSMDFRSCKLILEEQNLQYALDAEGENQMNECRKLQVVESFALPGCTITA